MANKNVIGLLVTLLVFLCFLFIKPASGMDSSVKHGVSIRVIYSDNLVALREMPSESVDMIYVDPPFNTGRKQIRNRFHTCDSVRVEEDTYGYEDSFDDLVAFLKPRMYEAYRILKPHGSLFFHLDYREIHYCKVMLDQIFGRESFINEIIWAYDYGARSKKRWSAKHDNILWYAKDPNHYTFNYDDIDRIPYMAPDLVGPEKAARGKTPTDVWWHTIVSPNSKEKTGYATQKPRGIIDRIVKVHSNKGDLLMDFFAGSGTLGESAYVFGRSCILVDNNNDSIAVMKRRFAGIDVDWENCADVKVAEISEKKISTHKEDCPAASGFYQPVPQSGNQHGKQARSLKKYAVMQLDLL